MDKTTQQASKVLGQNSGYKDSYAPEVLNPIDRSHDRKAMKVIGFNEDSCDVWHCYECSFLLPNGLPVAGVGKLVVPAHSPNIVESKSLKLYLFSMNMERYASIDEYEQVVIKDLSNVVGAPVKFKLITEEPESRDNPFSEYIDVSHFCFTGLLKFDDYSENRRLLDFGTSEKMYPTNVKISQLRSNCRVTKQPDWGEVFIHLIPNKTSVDWGSVLQYVVSFRNEAHFHEEIVERIYTALMRKYDPTRLIVTSTYTRRGGIDICPMRTNVPLGKSLASFGDETQLTWLPMRS